MRDAPLFSEVKLYDDRVPSNTWRCHTTRRSRMTLDRSFLLFCVARVALNFNRTKFMKFASRSHLKLFRIIRAIFLIYWRYVSMDFLSSFLCNVLCNVGFQNSSSFLRLASRYLGIDRELNPGNSKGKENSPDNRLCFIQNKTLIRRQN